MARSPRGDEVPYCTEEPLWLGSRPGLPSPCGCAQLLHCPMGAHSDFAADVQGGRDTRNRLLTRIFYVPIYRRLHASTKLLPCICVFASNVVSNTNAFDINNLHSCSCCTVHILRPDGGLSGLRRQAFGGVKRALALFRRDSISCAPWPAVTIKEVRYFKESNVSKSTASSATSSGASAESITFRFDVFTVRCVSVSVWLLKTWFEDSDSTIARFEHLCRPTVRCSARNLQYN